MRYLLISLTLLAVAGGAAYAQGLVGMSGEGLPRYVVSDEVCRTSAQFEYWRRMLQAVTLVLSIAFVALCRARYRSSVRLAKNTMLFAVLLPLGIYLAGVQVLGYTFG